MTKEEREKAIATAIDVFEYQIKRSEDVKCRKCDECGENPFEDYCIKDVAKWLSLALEVLRQESGEDAISRKEVYEQINCWIGSGEYKYTNATDYLTKRIANLSSVRPTQKG